jgi:environmental stress-induced protein Ves
MTPTLSGNASSVGRPGVSSRRAVPLQAQASVRFIDCAALPAEPWANGHGTTRTIARAPSDSSDATWRVSLATLDGAAKFSQFSGFDRTLLLVDEGTIDLHSQDGQLIARTGQPVHFSGDLHVWVSMTTKAVNVLNVMTRRDSHRATVSIASNSLRITPAQSHLLISLAGQWTVASSLLRDVSLAPLKGIWTEGRHEQLDLRPLSPEALLVSIAIEPVERLATSN